MKMTKLLAATALALSVFSGASIAHEDNVFMDRTMMMPFFTDDTMQTARSDEELRTAFAAMSPEAQERLIKDCNDPMQYRNQYHYGLCDKIK